MIHNIFDRLSEYIGIRCRYLVIIYLLAALCACGQAQAARSRASDGSSRQMQQNHIDDRLATVSGETAHNVELANIGTVAPAWQPLARQLAGDGIYGPRVNALLDQLAPVPTQAPMGRKIQELYQRHFFPRPKSATTAQYYKGVVTEANASLCRQFIKQHEAAFIMAQNRYGVPPAIASALLFVETRLGKVLGDVPENAFYTLASMAISTSPEDISQWLPRLKNYEQHLGWIQETMRKRAHWAYNETRALVEHILRDNIPLSQLPGSIYGAVGLCQFMPSNISVYGADGDGDGRVDLFTVPDAVASLANYLARHGWKEGISREKQHKVLMSYNHSVVYANTILALAQLVSSHAPVSGTSIQGGGNS